MVDSPIRQPMGWHSFIWIYLDLATFRLGLILSVSFIYIQNANSITRGPVPEPSQPVCDDGTVFQCIAEPTCFCVYGQKETHSNRKKDDDGGENKGTIKLTRCYFEEVSDGVDDSPIFGVGIGSYRPVAKCGKNEKPLVVPPALFGVEAYCGCGLLPTNDVKCEDPVNGSCGGGCVKNGLEGTCELEGDDACFCDTGVIFEE